MSHRRLDDEKCFMQSVPARSRQVLSSLATVIQVVEKKWNLSLINLTRSNAVCHDNAFP